VPHGRSFLISYSSHHHNATARHRQQLSPSPPSTNSRLIANTTWSLSVPLSLLTPPAPSSQTRIQNCRHTIASTCLSFPIYSFFFFLPPPLSCPCCSARTPMLQFSFSFLAVLIPDSSLRPDLPTTPSNRLWGQESHL
jgi:hypothetical protein